jgi:hypothetical protein
VLNTVARWTVSDSEIDEEPVVVTVFRASHVIEGILWKKKGHARDKRRRTAVMNVVAQTLFTITKRGRPSVEVVD